MRSGNRREIWYAVNGLGVAETEVVGMETSTVELIIKMQAKEKTAKQTLKAKVF